MIGQDFASCLSNQKNVSIIAWKSHFLTWWPWPLTYELDHRTWPRYGSGRPACQIPCLYAKRFNRESADRRTDTLTDGTDSITSTAGAGGNDLSSHCQNKKNYPIPSPAMCSGWQHFQHVQNSAFEVARSNKFWLSTVGRLVSTNGRCDKLPHKFTPIHMGNLGVLAFMFVIDHLKTQIKFHTVALFFHNRSTVFCGHFHRQHHLLIWCFGISDQF